MQIHRAFVLLALCALLVWGTAAQDDAIKIGIVDIDQAISSTDEGKAAREEFARKQREAEQQMQPLMDRYKGVEEELKAKKFVLSEEALFQKQLDLAEMRNQAETLIYTTEQALEGYADLLDAEKLEKVRGEVDLLRRMLETGATLDSLRAAYAQLENSTFEIAEAMYAS